MWSRRNNIGKKQFFHYPVKYCLVLIRYVQTRRGKNVFAAYENIFGTELFLCFCFVLRKRLYSSGETPGRIRKEFCTFAHQKQNPHVEVRSGRNSGRKQFCHFTRSQKGPEGILQFCTPPGSIRKEFRHFTRHPEGSGRNFPDLRTSSGRNFAI